MNRVTHYRIKGLEDPAGLPRKAYIFQLAEQSENYAVDSGYQFSSGKTAKWKKGMQDRGFALLAKYGYPIKRQTKPPRRHAGEPG